MRSWCRRSVVLTSCGDVIGTTEKNALVPAALTCGTETNATCPLSERIESASRVTVAASAALYSAAMMNGPLEPAPKPVANKS